MMADVGMAASADEMQIWIIKGLSIMRTWLTNYVALIFQFFPRDRPCSTSFTGVLRVVGVICLFQLQFVLKLCTQDTRERGEKM